MTGGNNRTLRAVALPDDALPRTLPSLHDPLIGRELEMERVTALLDEYRLVTITGTGGVGKTRVAVEVASAVDPVLFVSFAAISDPSLVTAMIAATAGFDTSGGRPPAEVVAMGLAGRAALVVLDTFEHVLPAAADVLAMLGACPRLRVLVTSRIALRVRGEIEVELQPLDAAASTELLIRSVQRFDPGFAGVGGDADAVAEICRSVEGLPLAIELAAARLRLLGPRELAGMLANRLDPLRSHLRDAPPHQQTMRATIDWSYRLLGEDDRRVLRWLSVFAGGFTIDAVATVTGADTFDVLDRLDGLVAHHLVRVLPSADGEGRRFELLDSIREFAAGELAAGGEREAACQGPRRVGPRPRPRSRADDHRRRRGSGRRPLRR